MVWYDYYDPLPYLCGAVVGAPVLLLIGGLALWRLLRRRTGR